MEKAKHHKPHTAAAAALSMSQIADVQPIGRRLSLQQQTDLRQFSSIETFKQWHCADYAELHYSSHAYANNVHMCMCMIYSVDLG